MKIFYPIFFLAVTNKLIEHEFGNRNRYCSEIIVCILFILYAIRYNAYVINYTYIITLLLLDFLFFPLLILLIRKSTHFQNRRPLQVCEKKNFLYWLSIIDLAFIICVNIKINGHFFATLKPHFLRNRSIPRVCRISWVFFWIAEILNSESSPIVTL